MAVLDRLIAFRAPTDLIAEISDMARQQDTSVSELLRSLICAAVAREANVPEERLPIHTRAAFGDGAALSHLANCYRERGINGVEPNTLALAQAVIFARLSAINTGARQEWVTFIQYLQEYSDALRTDRLGGLADIAQAEAVALAEHMGDFGDEEAGGLAVAAGDSLSPQVLAMARDLHSIGMGEAA